MEDIAQHILDLLMNALEAGATEVSLTIEEGVEEDRLVIAISDNGRGLSEDKLEQVMDPFVTTRKTRRVGLGLPLLKETAERCEGSVVLCNKETGGLTVRAVFCLSHWDRPPLGDVASSITACLCADSLDRLVYTHRVKEKLFCMDTQEVAQWTDPLQLSHPKVLVWLKTFMQQEIKRLQDHGGE